MGKDAGKEVLSSASLGALESVRRSLFRHPGALAAFALAAGLTTAQGNAWAGGYESLGRSIGYELGRTAGPGVPGRVASMVLQSVGGSVAAPMDAAPQTSDQRRAAELQRQAREQAGRDAAYAAERKRLDPSYVASAGVATAQGARPWTPPPLTPEQRRAQQVEKEAREQAIRDHAYKAERLRLDPTYGVMVQRSEGANSRSADAQRIKLAQNDVQADARSMRRQDVEAP